MFEDDKDIVDAEIIEISVDTKSIVPVRTSITTHEEMRATHAWVEERTKSEIESIYQDYIRSTDFSYGFIKFERDIYNLKIKESTLKSNQYLFQLWQDYTVSKGKNCAYLDVNFVLEFLTSPIADNRSGREGEMIYFAANTRESLALMIRRLAGKLLDSAMQPKFRELLDYWNNELHERVVPATMKAMLLFSATS